MDEKEFLMREHLMLCNYHDHKERMAWTASALYFLFTTALVKWLLSRAGMKWLNSQSDCGGWIIAGGLFVILVCLIAFLWMQFTSRWEANDYSGALRMYVLTDEAVNKEGARPIRLNIPKKYKRFVSKAPFYPISVGEFFAQGRADRNIGSFFKALSWILFFFILIPIYWKSCGSQRDKLAPDRRWLTEIPTYILVILFFAAQLWCVLHGVGNLK